MRLDWTTRSGSIERSRMARLNDQKRLDWTIRNGSVGSIRFSYEAWCYFIVKMIRSRFDVIHSENSSFFLCNQQLKIRCDSKFLFITNQLHRTKIRIGSIKFIKNEFSYWYEQNHVNYNILTISKIQIFFCSHQLKFNVKKSN